MPDDPRSQQPPLPGLTRRQFIQTAGAVGLGAVLSRLAPAEDAKPRAVDDLRIAPIGAGTQGRVLMQDCLRIPGVRFVAVCDIWPYHRDYTIRFLKNYRHVAKPYEDYRDLLAPESDLDAVIIATPDWMHAEQTIACLRAGKHVYCEKEMSNTLAGARQMVQAARETGKLLQIGHQRRSNPRYRAALEYVRDRRALGRIVHLQGQWNRAQWLDVGWPKNQELDAAVLERYGYGTMNRFRNWRWYREFSGGPMADLGSHQVDIFNWFLGATPRAAVATGGMDYYRDREWYDNVNALYEWQCEMDAGSQIVRGHYQVLNGSSHGGYFETFIGDEGSMIITEDPGKGGIRREVDAPAVPWEDQLARLAGDAERPQPASPAQNDASEGAIRIGHTIPAPGRYFPLPVPVGYRPQPVHTPHLENFFGAIRNPKQCPLTCPGEEAYRTAVSVLRVNDALASGKKIEFAANDFTV